MQNETTPLIKPSSASGNDVESVQPTEKIPINGNVTHSASIGMLGSFSIAVNSLVGPAILNLPATYQNCGLIPTTGCILLVCFLSIMCSLHMANVISKIPGNNNFQKEVEYSEAFRYFTPKYFVFTQISFFMCILCANMASIVDTAQVVDDFLANFGGRTVALRMHPPPIELVRWNGSDCQDPELGPCDPFNLEGDGSLLITSGYVISLISFLPLGLMDLKENASSQILCFIVTLGVCIQFMVFFMMQGFNFENISLWGDSWDELFGITLFNFTLVTAIPAWLYEKNPHIDVGQVVHYSSGLSSALYILIGVMGALSIQNVSENMLSSMITGEYGVWTQLGASIFAFLIIGLGIPLFSVIMRLNLTGSGMCSRKTGDFLAVILPWSISWLFYKSAITTKLLSWGGILFTSIIAFVAPLALALVSVLVSKCHGFVPVCGKLHCFDSQKAEVFSLVSLISLASVSILLSIAGQFFGN